LVPYSHSFTTASHRIGRIFDEKKVGKALSSLLFFVGEIQINRRIFSSYSLLLHHRQHQKMKRGKVTGMNKKL
jgi:hypothetical protein